MRGQVLARPYRSEMTELKATIDWISHADISAIRTDLAQSAHRPIIAVGSGGSLSAAQHLARLHRQHYGRVSRAMTPYEFISGPIPKDGHHWLFSAGGSNVDVVAAADAGIRAETHAMSILTMRPGTRLSRMCANEPMVRVHYLDAPSKKDGFLATNSLLAFCAVMTRAYLEERNHNQEWAHVLAGVQHHLRGESPSRASWRQAAATVVGADHLIVLYDSATSLGAFDLESKLTEAAAANVQVADYRHFAHGRHHWLAKNGANTGVLALISMADPSLARRTLALIPSDVPRGVVDIPDDGEAAQLASLLAAFYVTEELSFSKGVDPGQPGVPDFGRKLYRLRLSQRERRSSVQAAISRKLDARVTTALPTVSLTDEYREFVDRLTSARLVGLVLDYDGTVVDTPDRFEPPRSEVAGELVRILRAGLRLGIATGRGRSAGIDLRAALPESLWASVTIGYYNGATVRGLDIDDPLDLGQQLSSDLLLLQDAIRTAGSSLPAVRLTLRPQQLTVESTAPLPEGRLWECIRAQVDELDISTLRVTRSSHSVDVVARSASKLRVIETVAEQAPPGEILRIGDRGRWPGNDFELLASPLGLSVDEVSPDLRQCWNLAPEGVRGYRATLHYLRSVHVVDGVGQFRLEDS